MPCVSARNSQSNQQQPQAQGKKTSKIGQFLCGPIRAVRSLGEKQSDLDEKKEAFALLHACENSRLAALTSCNSSTTHLLAPPSPSATEQTTPPTRTMRSATIVRVVSHTTLGAAPLGSSMGQNQQTAQRPPMISRGSTRSILKSSPKVRTPEEGMRRGSRMGSVVSWTLPLMGQIGEDTVEGSSAGAGPSSLPAQLAGGVPMEEDRIIGGSLVRVRTKLFRRTSYGNDEEEFEEILLDGAGKQVFLVWGEGVDDIIS